MGDAAALFAASGSGGVASNAAKKKFVKRTKLWDQDHAAVTMLEPFSKSQFDNISDKDLYKSCSEGGTFCIYHSNLCAQVRTTDEPKLSVEEVEYVFFYIMSKSHK